MRTQTSFIFSIGALALLASPAHADRGRNPLAGQPAIRHRVEMRKMRFEITPQLMLSANQPYLIGIGGGVALQFHLTDWLGIGGSFHYTHNIEAPLVGRIEQALPETYAGSGDPTAGLKQPSRQMFRDHLVGPKMLAGLYATLTPMAGKFSLFNVLFAKYDFYGLVGLGVGILDTPLASGLTTYPDSAGAMRMVRDDAATTANDVNLQKPTPFTGTALAGLFGIGVHVYFNNFVGLNLELRDYMYKANPGGLDVTTLDNNADGSPVLSDQDKYLVNSLYFGLGLTILLPPGAKTSR